MFSVVKTYKIWFATSGLLVTASLILLFAWGLKLGIDFRGGILLEAEFEQAVSVSKIRQKLLSQGYGHVVVQAVTEKTLIIKTEPLEGEGLENFKKLLRENFGNYLENRFDSIGPIIGRELVGKAYKQIALVSFGIILYIAYSFRKIDKSARAVKLSSWRLGLAAVMALAHDILITIGVFVVLGKFAGVEIDSLFVTALLTILGFSVHDTIVVFDRIREGLQLYAYKPLGSIIDYSVNSTLARSINTSSTLIIVLIAMLLFGGETIFYFVLALLIGVTVGTYSSIFIASPILYLWQK